MPPSRAAAQSLAYSAPEPSPGPELPEGVLSKGDRGEAVRQLQAALLELEYLEGRADGAFGPMTEAALKRFQAAARLKADGVYGSRTRAALLEALRARTPPAPRPPVMPPVLWRPSLNSESREGAPIDAIILHHTASNRVTVDLATLRRRRGSNRVSAHYLISPRGVTYQLVKDELAAWHAGVSSLHGEKEPSVNARSIGIELTNDGSGRTPFTEAQYRALEKLVPYLVWTYRVPRENVVGHRDVAPGRKTDPADNFDWKRVRRAIDALPWPRP